MAAFPDDPGGFSRWLVAKGLATEETALLTFAPRAAFGAYLGEVLSCERERSPAKLTIVHESANALENGTGLTVVTDGGRRIDADHVVLATGNLPARTPRALRRVETDPRYIANPWRGAAFVDVEPEDSVLIVGTGLTMVDTFLSLAAKGHRGRVFARSRRGLLPKAHAPSVRRSFPIEEVGEDLLPWVIDFLRGEEEGDWRGMLDGMRPHTMDLWQRLSWSERARFIQKLRPFWEVHRHRIAEQAASALENAMNAGFLSVGKGRISATVPSDRAFHVEFADTSETLSVRWIVNCTGPNLDVRSEKIPLLESIVQSGLGSYDPLGLGLIVDDAGKVGPSERLWALGALCRGCRWETTAIPEIRTQAARICQEVMRDAEWIRTTE